MSPCFPAHNLSYLFQLLCSNLLRIFRNRLKSQIDLLFFFYWRYNPLYVCILQPSGGAIASSLMRFLDHTQRRATFGRTPLNEGSVRRRDLYLTTHNTHNTNINDLGGIRTYDLSRRAAVDLRLRPRSHWDRLLLSLLLLTL